jgi:putative ABC transport system permease protein
MISNYFKTTLRIIWRHRVHSIINIVGLAVGMACTILILLWVRFEFSFDRYHENAGRIYRLATDFHFGAFQGKYATSNHPAGPTLQRDYPEVEKAVRFHAVWGGSLVRYKDRRFVEHHLYYADPTVFDVFTLPLLRGDPASALETAYAVVLSEGMAAKYFNGEDPLGKTIKIGNALHSNLHNEPSFTGNLYNPIEPLFMENDPAKFNYALVKIRPGNLAEAMGFLEKKWREIDSSGAFHYWFLEDDHASNYRPIRQIGALFVGFTLVAILIACMGLFGLALFSAAQRTREIGIRKALGATAADIARMLARSSIKWVLAANMFAWPLTYLFSRGWLEDYPYRIEVGIGIFIFAGVLALAVALLTVSWQAIKTARANPVDALRYE